jgi:4-hydroxy-tetrahydrodipicolinate reductase
MHDFIRVVLLGTGQMGSGIARLLLEKPGLELVGAYARRAERRGLDLGPLIDLDKELGISVSNDLETTLEQSQPHIAIQATCSTVEDAMGEITTLLRHGVHVISIAEEMAFPTVCSPAFAEQIHWLAKANQVAVLGTGINPGFILDLLVITLSGVCANIESITAKRVNDLSPYGSSVLMSQGVGLTPEAFQTGLENKTVVGHIGFTESIHMIAAALGWEIERIEEKREAIVTQVRRETPFITIEPGQVAGCHHTAVAYREGKPVITLIHPQQVYPSLEGVETGDYIEIKGMPHVSLSGTPEIPGGQATCALAVNMIPRVLTASPGLHTMADLPVPAAMLGDVRKLVNSYKREEPHG